MDGERLRNGAEQRVQAAESWLPTPESTGVEDTLRVVVAWLQTATETAAVLAVLLGVVATVPLFFRTVAHQEPARYDRVRLAFGRHLALALEFQLAADVLATTVAPSWEQIGKLAAIAVIRTALNFFLEREMRVERENVEHETRARAKESG